MFNGKLKAGDNDISLFQGYKTILEKAMEEGFKSGNLAKGQGTLLLEQLKTNASVFSAFKQHNQIADMAAALVDDQGKLRSFSAFKKAVAPITQKYSNNWLRAEYNHAVGSARMAAQWQTYVEKGGMLAYYTIGDGRVREEHQVLNGTVLPVTDPFWDTYYPPNGWNCRCYVRWKGNDHPPVTPNGAPKLQPMFSINVGKNPNPLSVIDLKNRLNNESLNKVFEILNDDTFGRDKKKLLVRYELSPRIRLIEKSSTGGYIYSHQAADKKDYNDNLAASRVIINNSDSIILIRGEMKKSESELAKIQGWIHKNAELVINGVITDLKTPGLHFYKNGIRPTANSIRNKISENFGEDGQQLKEIVFNLNFFISNDRIASTIYDCFNSKKRLEALHFVRNERYVKINSNESLSSIYEKINMLFL